ncbi:MAG: glycosyltransferase family 4 protein, partial [Amphiplicatus sp.]
PDEPLKISYISGPGDLKGTFDHWRAGAFDPRTPSIAYSTQYFELGKRLHAELQVIMRGEPALNLRQEDHVTFSRIPIPQSNGLFGYWKSLIGFALQCRSHLKAFRPHIVIVASNFFWPCFALLRTNGARLVLTVHTTCWPMGMRKFSGRMKLENLLRKFGLIFVDTAICTSPECANQVDILSSGRIPSRVQYPQQIRRWDSSQASPAASDSAFRRIVFVGRIEENKGVLDLLEAFRRIRVNHPDARLCYAGSGTFDGELRKRAEQEIAEGSVELLGHLDSAAVHAELNRAHVLVCPTTSRFFEGNAVVCYEAAVHGVPVIASTMVPAREQLAEGCLSFEADSVEELAAALDSVFGDSALYAKLSENVKKVGAIVFDRSRSWGSQLYPTMLEAAEKKKR